MSDCKDTLSTQKVEKYRRLIMLSYLGKAFLMST